VQRVSIYGEPAHDGGNVVLVCHALTGSSRVADWWGGIVGPGKLLDTERFAVVGVNAIGGCYGSTGPASTAPDGRPYGSRFPLVTVADIVRGEAAALSALGIRAVRAAVGGSLGGMQAYAWAALRPLPVEAAAVVGAYDYFSAMGIALNAVAREAIRNDPAFAGGDYYGGDGPRRGIELARKIAMLTYKSDALFHQRFERKVDRNGGDPYANAADRFDVEGYLDHQGAIFSQRMDPNAYLALTRAMDLFDLRDRSPAPGGPAVTFVGISSDWLFPPSYVRETADRIASRGARSTYLELDSDHGHDAFLAEPDALAALLLPSFV
jgi:homoserine O-acetyltransferase